MVGTFFGVILLIAFFVFKAMAPSKVKANLPGFLTPVVIGICALIISVSQFNKMFFYAEPGYIYHVRTITGEEKVVDGVADTGYNAYWWGRFNAWKRAITVQASDEATAQALSSETAENVVSASLPRMNITFLDQVDANAAATARFKLPTDRESFLRIVHEYRSPENLLRTSLIPAFQETLISTAQLMGAEEFFSGGRTEFNNEFDNQLRNGIYIVSREEKIIQDDTSNMPVGANASLGPNQGQMDDGKKVIFLVEKQVDENGIPKRKKQIFTTYGVDVVEARVTYMNPNVKFRERMQLKQKASADRAIAREQRIQEEEQRLLAIAKGEREVAERQAEAKVEQIEKTTNAETDKQLAITEATKQKEQATIEKETAAIQLDKAKLEAARTKTLADAEAYKKKAVLLADNALAQKLDAEIEIQKIWADAFSKRKVPEIVFGGGGNGSTPTGSDSETRAFMQMLTMDAAKRLSYDRDVKK